ncbi:DUF2804 family protein [Mycoplasmatota bacterium]|nr:DUF2804 family protein [Mycoplasmatota bacterium]
MEVNKIVSAPKKPVEDGKFIFGIYNTPFEEVNMLDAKKIWKFPVPKFIKQLRLAEWEAFQLWDGHFFIMCVVGVSHIARNAITEIFVYDNNKETIIFKDFGLHKKSLLKRENALISSEVNLKTDKVDYRIINDLGNSNTISVEVKCEDFEIYFTGNHQTAIPLCYCMPFAKNRGLYSHKNYVEASGYMKIGDEMINFTKDARMNIDDHKGYYPFRNSYDWVTTSTKIDDDFIGLNLTKNQILNPEKNNENVIWVNGKTGKKLKIDKMG